MKFGIGNRISPSAVGLACAAGATSLGLAYMAAADAPFRYLAVNAAALGMGIAAFAIARRLLADARFPSAAMLALGATLLATAGFGSSAEGAARWVSFGSLSVQVSLVVLPLLVVSFAVRRDALATAAMVLAALALAAQPDRAMAGTLAGGLAALAMLKPDRWTMTALSAAAGAFVATLARPDDLPAVPYVDGILYSAFDVHPLAGAAVVAGACLLVLPAVAGRLRDAEHAHVHLVFGTVWLGIVAAAALGNYPTPLVGYGGSAILGYLLSLAALPGGAPYRGRARVEAGPDRLSEADDDAPMRLRTA